MTIQRRSVPDGDTDGYPDEEAVYNPVLTGVRAVVSIPKGMRSGMTDSRQGSLSVEMKFRLAADPCDLQLTDQVLDETTGALYRTDWVLMQHGYGLDHVAAGLSIVEGYAP